jgi:Ca2+:H+ antiporter
MASEATRETTMSRAWRNEWALPISVLTMMLFLVFGKGWLSDLSGRGWFAVMLGWLFAAILAAAFGVVRHAEALAERVGEPLGTLVLTLAMSGMEMMMIVAVMYTGKGAATLGRDTMMAILMIVLNGLVGGSLLLGGLRYREQTYNLYGANTFLSVLVPLAVLSLVLPRFTVSQPGPIHSPTQAVFLIVTCIALYAIFLRVQTNVHREYFVMAEGTPQREGESGHASGATSLHAMLLVAYAVTIVFMSKQIAVPIDYAINVLRAPAALGGLLVAVLILSPESLAALRAALANKLQRSINLSLGTALSTISLTTPAVLVIGFLTGRDIVLGLGPVEMVMLLLTLGVSLLTFALERTNVLQGAIHLVLFAAYLVLIFD